MAIVDIDKSTIYDAKITEAVTFHDDETMSEFGVGPAQVRRCAALATESGNVNTAGKTIRTRLYTTDTIERWLYWIAKSNIGLGTRSQRRRLCD